MRGPRLTCVLPSSQPATDSNRESRSRACTTSATECNAGRPRCECSSLPSFPSSVLALLMGCNCLCSCSAFAIADPMRRAQRDVSAVFVFYFPPCSNLALRIQPALDFLQGRRHQAELARSSSWGQIPCMPWWLGGRAWAEAFKRIFAPRMPPWGRKWQGGHRQSPGGRLCLIAGEKSRARFYERLNIVPPALPPSHREMA